MAVSNAFAESEDAVHLGNEFEATADAALSVIRFCHAVLDDIIGVDWGTKFSELVAHVSICCEAPCFTCAGVVVPNGDTIGNGNIA